MDIDPLEAAIIEMTAGESFDYSDSLSRSISVTRHYALPDFDDVIGGMRYAGVSVSDLPHEFRNDGSYDPRFTQEYGERNAVAFLLASAGFRNLDLTSKKPPFPDVQVAFHDGTTAFVETAEIIGSPSARLNGALTFVNVGISRTIKSDAALDAKLKGHHISVRAWITSDDGQYDSHAILDEFLTFLRESTFDQLPAKEMVAFGSEYRALTSIDAKYYCDKIDAISMPRFDPAAHSFSPESLASQVLPILNRKIARGASYQGEPLWLALYMSDPLGVPELSLDNLEGVALDFVPFEKLIVGDQRSVLVYSVGKAPAAA